jgi:hypothetical protein
MNGFRSDLTWVLLGLTLGVISGAEAAQAQSYLMPQTPEKGIWLEATHPEVKAFGDVDLTVASSAWFLSGRHPLTSRLAGVAEVPFAYGNVDISGAPALEGKSVFGNPYVGVEFALNDRVTFEGGARFPITTADEESFGDVVGVLADMMRMEAFMIDVVPISAAATLRHTLASGLGLRARGGVTSVVWTGDSDLGESFTFMDYGVFAQYPVSMVRFGAGVAGRWNVTEDEGGFSENSLHHVGLSADYAIGRFRPGVNVRVPLDKEYRDLVSSSIGLYVQMSLP